MKKVAVTIQYDEEKLSTLKICMEKKELNIDDEIIKFIDNLYTKQVPIQVREFFKLKVASEKKSSSKSNKNSRGNNDKNDQNPII
jgi:hypothetical protein